MSLLSYEEARPWARSITNADDFHDELQNLLSRDVTITGLWRVGRIEIQKIEPGRSR